MSIGSQIDRINNNIANTYDVLESAGATMPAETNSDNLAATAQTISAVLYGKAQELTDGQKAQARENIDAPSSSDIPDVSKYLPLAGGSMANNASLKFTKYGNRYLTIDGNAISADMSNCTGGWAGSPLSVKDPAGDTTTLLGWYGGASGLNYIYMGGTYSAPYLKMTKGGQFTFASSPYVGSTKVALSSDIPSALKNPNPLTFTGAVEGTYDGSEAKTIDIPTIKGEKGDKGDTGAPGFLYIVGDSTTTGVWTGTCDEITEYYEGLTIIYKTNIAGASGLTLNINGLGAVSVVRNTTSAVTTHYGVGSVLILTYTTDASGTSYWKLSDYDSDTKTRSSNLASTKMYLIGAKAQSTSGQTTYSNKNCYIGTDNCLYSGGEKVITVNETDFKVSVKKYGAKGDGSTDDTTAFQNALAANRLVYVPAGTYKLTAGIVIGDNCMLELSQDAVLEFTNTSGNCITLGMLSTLKGNHATVKVPYEFTGNVLYAYSADNTSDETLAVSPFTRWDPMWKSGRYVTDINICKADSRGFHYSVDGECSGTAVYLSANGLDGYLTYMWGIHFSGLRIAGAFSYGIRAVNLNEAWMHEMRLDAFIDACEIGVCLEDCNNVYVSAVVQPRKAYSTSGVYKAYAKHGIQLIRSKNADLSGSRVWDWDADKTLWTDGGEYQQISMIGDCSGAILNDFRYYAAGDTRDRIYTDTSSNLEKITIIQEPFTRWFKPIDSKPYFFDGYKDEKLITQTDIDGYFDTDVVKNFTDALETAIGTDGNVYEGVGYKVGRRVASDGTEVDEAYYVLTGFIPCSKGDVIYTHHMTMASGDDNCCVQFFDADFSPVLNGTYPVRVNRGLLISNGNTYTATYTEMDSGFKLEVSGNSIHDTTAYVRFVIYRQAWGQHPMISVNNEIKYTMEGFLADGIKVDSQNVNGLNAVSYGTQTLTDDQKTQARNNIGASPVDHTHTAEEVDFILPADGEYVAVPDFTDAKSPYQENVWCNAGTMTSLTNGSHIWIEPRHFAVGDVIRIQGVNFTSNWPGKARVDLFNADGSYRTTHNMVSLIGSSASGALSTFATYAWDSATSTLTITVNGTNAAAMSTSYMFAFGGQLATGYTTESVIMTVNEEITYSEVWEGEPKRLDPTLYAQNLVLTSPNGTIFKLSVSDSGVLSAEPFSG